MDDSAYPVIRSGDLVLMEAVANLEVEEIERLEDRIVVALTLSAYAYMRRSCCSAVSVRSARDG